MAILIILSRESFDVVVASLNWTFLRSLILMGEHVSFEVLEDFATFWVCAAPFFA